MCHNIPLKFRCFLIRHLRFFFANSPTHGDIGFKNKHAGKESKGALFFFFLAAPLSSLSASVIFFPGTLILQPQTASTVRSII